MKQTRKIVRSLNFTVISRSYHIKSLTLFSILNLKKPPDIELKRSEFCFHLLRSELFFYAKAQGHFSNVRRSAKDVNIVIFSLIKRIWNEMQTSFHVNVNKVEKGGSIENRILIDSLFITRFELDFQC